MSDIFFLVKILPYRKNGKLIMNFNDTRTCTKCIPVFGNELIIR